METKDYNAAWKEKWTDCSRFGPSLRFQQKIISRLLSRIEYRSVLDAGCGNGVRLARLIADRGRIRIAGVDFSDEAVLQAAALFPAGRFRRLDLERESLDEQFDLVICSEVLEHLADDVSAIANLFKMTGKYLLVSSPQGKMNREDAAVGHVRRYRRGELQEKLAAAGFRIRRVVQWGFPFFSPVHRYLLDRFSGVSEGKFGWKRLLIAEIVYLIFHFNSWRKGDMLVILAEKPGHSGL